MKKLQLLLFVFLSCHSVQTIAPRAPLTGNIKTDLNKLLPAGTVTADIMGIAKPSERQTELTEKFMDGVKKNYNWFIGYLKTVPKGQTMPYDANMGLTESEYQELLNFEKNIKEVSTGNGNITISKEHDRIKLSTSSYPLTLINLFNIDLSDNNVFFGKYKLSFTDTVNVRDSSNALGSAWRGYSWEYHEPKDFNLDDIKDIQTVSVKQYEFTIGRLDNDGKTFIEFKCTEYDKGVKKADTDISLLF